MTPCCQFFWTVIKYELDTSNSVNGDRVNYMYIWTHEQDNINTDFLKVGIITGKHFFFRPTTACDIKMSIQLERYVQVTHY